MLKRSLFLCLLAAALVMLQPDAVPAVAAQAPAAGKVYELRIYTASPGRLADLQALFRGPAMRLFAKHGMEHVFYSSVLEGAQVDGADAPSMVIYILGHASREAADKSWTALRADPEWQATIAKTREPGPLTAKPTQSVFMSATDFSPALEAPSAANAQPRVFELRRYNTGAAGLPYTLHRFKVGMAAILAKTGMTPIGYWTATDNSALIYLVAHKDREAARASWSAFLPDYRAFMAEYPKRPDSIAAAPRTPEDNRFLVPTDYSPRR